MFFNLMKRYSINTNTMPAINKFIYLITLPIITGKSQQCYT